jgi:hypothetical protein
MRDFLHMGYETGSVLNFFASHMPYAPYAPYAKSARLFATIQSELHMKVAYGIANRVECPYAALFCRIVAHTSKTHIIMADSDFEHDSDSTTTSDNEERDENY